RRTERDRADDAVAPRRRAAGKKRGRDEVEPHRWIAGGERAIAPALIARHESGGEFLCAAELRDLRRPGAAPMVLEDRVDGQAWTEGEREQKEDRGARGEAKDSALERKADGTGSDHRDGIDPDRDVEMIVDEGERRPIAEKEAVARAIEQAACPKIDARQQDQSAAEQQEASGEPQGASHHIAFCKRRRI